MTDEYKFRNMAAYDLSFFNEVRNECRFWLHDPTEYSLEQCQKWFNTMIPQFYIVERNGERIGYFRTSNWNREHHLVSIGADFHKDYRGKGYARPAYRAFMEKLLAEFAINTFFLEVLSHNVVARHLYERLGFVEFSSREHRTIDGVVIYSISMFRRLHHLPGFPYEW